MQTEKDEVMLDLKDFEFDELIEYLGKIGEPKYRAQQIFTWLHKGVTSYDEMTNISAKTPARWTPANCNCASPPATPRALSVSRAKCG